MSRQSKRKMCNIEDSRLRRSVKASALLLQVLNNQRVSFVLCLWMAVDRSPSRWSAVQSSAVSHNTRALRPPPPPPPSPPADSTSFSERTRTQEPLFDRCCRTQIELDDFIKSVRDLALTELSAGRGVQIMLGKAPVTQPQAPPVMMPSRVCSPVDDRRSVFRSLEGYSEAHQRYVVAPERAHFNQSSLYHSQENACPVPCRHPSHMLHLDSFTQPNVARSPTSGDNSAGASSQSVFRPKACAPSTHLKLGIVDKVEGQWNGEWLPGESL